MGAGIETGLVQVFPPSVDWLTVMVGTTRSTGRSGIDEISHVLWRWSKATLASLTRSYWLPGGALFCVRPGRKPELQVPLGARRAHPMSDAPPLKNRPTWKPETSVPPPSAKVSGSTSVACWLVVFVNGSVLTRVTPMLALAG